MAGITTNVPMTRREMQEAAVALEEQRKRLVEEDDFLDVALDKATNPRDIEDIEQKRDVLSKRIEVVSGLQWRLSKDG